MSKQRSELSPAEISELEQLTEEFSVTAGALKKTLRVENPPTLGEMKLFLEADAQLAAVLARIKELFGHDS